MVDRYFIISLNSSTCSSQAPLCGLLRPNYATRNWEGPKGIGLGVMRALGLKTSRWYMSLVDFGGLFFRSSGTIYFYTKSQFLQTDDLMMYFRIHLHCRVCLTKWWLPSPSITPKFDFNMQAYVFHVLLQDLMAVEYFSGVGSIVTGFRTMGFKASLGWLYIRNLFFFNMRYTIIQLKWNGTPCNMHGVFSCFQKPCS